MKITDIKTASIAGNFKWLLVQLYTDEGLVGLGECYWGVVSEALVQYFAPLLIGENPHNIDWLYQKMVRGASGTGTTGGSLVSAISGIELALWDLKGKALSTPTYNVLGGCYRTRLPVYGDCGHGHRPTPEAWAERAHAAVAKGFKAIKFDVDNIAPERFADPYHVGIYSRRGGAQGQQRPLENAELDLIVELVGAVRQAIGPAIDLAIDCHWNYNTRDAIQLSRALAPFRLLWLEDPVPPDNVEALKRVTDQSPVPICSGENHYTRHGFRPMIVSQAVDIVQPDIPKVGGLLESKKIADLADLYYLPIAAHNVSSPIGTVAACHACAGMRNFTTIEFHAQDIAWWDDLVVGEAPLIHDGYITLTDRPGLGLTLNPDVARAHPTPGTTFFG